MRICSWNINGLRSLRQPLRTVLEQLDCDIICFQETKVTRKFFSTNTKCSIDIKLNISVLSLKLIDKLNCV
jgi:exonuclease III